MAETRAKKLDQGVKASGGGANAHDKSGDLAIAVGHGLSIGPNADVTNGFRVGPSGRAYRRTLNSTAN